MTSPGWAGCGPIDPCTRVELQGLEFLGSGTPSTTHYGLTSWDGWDNGADGTGGAAAFELADGGVEGDVFFGPRAITLEGDIAASSHAELMEAREALGSILTRPRWDWLRVSEDHLGLDRRIRVSRVRRPSITNVGYTDAIWSLQLQAAAFPRLAEVESTAVLRAGESKVLANLGTYPGDLTVNLTGPLSGVSLSWTGASAGTWRYADAIPAGQSRVVEFTGRVVYNPANGAHSRVRASGAWAQLWPGDTTLKLNASGTGTARAIWRSAWS